MNAEAKILTPDECLAELRPKCAAMLAEVQAMLEEYPMDTMTRGDLGCIRFRLKMIVKD